MSPGKILIIAGLVLLALGIVVTLLPGSGLPRLPGDIHVRRENFSFYFPLGWSILISVVLTLVFWLFGR